MERIEPTHKEIMAELDCCYYSHWHKGIACVKLFYKEAALEYYRLYQESLTKEQQERRNTFIQWYATQRQTVKEIKSKPLSEITMEDKEFVEKIEDQLRGLEWL